MKNANPGVNWAALTGSNFTAQHAPAAIDFAAFHYWCACRLPVLQPCYCIGPFRCVNQPAMLHACCACAAPALLQRICQMCDHAARSLPAFASSGKSSPVI